MTLAIRLLQDIRHIFTHETLGSADLVRRLVRLDDRPWADGAGGRPITQARVARLLRPFGIQPMKLRFGATTANGYTRRMFADAGSRYLPRHMEQWNMANNDGDGLGNPRGEPDTAGSPSGTAVAHDTHGARSGVPPVAVERGPTGRGDGDAEHDDPPL